MHLLEGMRRSEPFLLWFASSFVIFPTMKQFRDFSHDEAPRWLKVIHIQIRQFAKSTEYGF